MIRWLFAMMAAGVVITSGVALAEKGAKAPEAKCPVSGEAISKDASIDYKGGKLYFCCPACKAKFEKDKAKLAAKANEQLVVTGQAVQKACPLTDRKVNASTAIVVDGVKVAFCCNGCKGKVTAQKPAEQIETVFGDKAFDKAFQVKTASK